MTDLVDIKIVSLQKEFDDAMSIRKSVFVEEQGIAPELEFDGNDFCSTHIVAYVNNKPVGTLRIRYFKDFVKFERAAVLKEFRKTNVSQAMMQTAAKFCALKGYEIAHGVCKKELLPRWSKSGVFPIKDATSVVQNGMTLIPVEQKLPKTKERITPQTSLDIINQKEGNWFENDCLAGSYPLDSKESLKHFDELSKKVKILKGKENVFDWHPPLKNPLTDDSNSR